MASFKINGKDFATQTGTGEPNLTSNVVFPSGMIVNSKVVENSTRLAVSGTSSSDVEFCNFGNYNKLFANTDLFIQVHLFTFASTDQWTGNIGLKYGGGSTYWTQSYTFNDIDKGQQLTMYAKINGHTAIGSQTISLRYGTADSGTTRPCQIINPGSSDDSRLNNLNASVAIIYEVNT